MDLNHQAFKTPMVRFLPLPSTKYSRLNTGFFVFEVCMSRSFKKVAGYVDRNPFMKKYSNKSLRRASRASLQAISNPNEYDGLISSFSYFKRCSVDQYRICDYRSLYYTERQLLASCIYRASRTFSYISLFTTSNDDICASRDDMTISSNKKILRAYYKALTK